MRYRWFWLLLCCVVGCTAPGSSSEENKPQEGISVVEGGASTESSGLETPAAEPMVTRDANAEPGPDVSVGAEPVEPGLEQVLGDASEGFSEEPRLLPEALESAGEAASEVHPSETAVAERSAPDAGAPEIREAVPEKAPPEPPRPACLDPAGKDLCDDGDDCNGRERCDTSTGKCLTASKPACPTAPAECKQSGGSSSPSTNRTTPATPHAGFRLQDKQQWKTYQDIIDRIAAHPGATKVSLSSVLRNLNRAATRVTSVSGVSCIEKGFRWNAGDTAVSYWYPQGLAGSATATSNGLQDGKRILVVSWYHKPANDSSTSTNKGVRVSFVDISNLSSISYRHALLVEPVMSGSRPNYKPVTIHAGGLVWFKQYLYVPDTSRGFRVFDLSRILQVNTSDKSKVGYDSASNTYHGFAYRYVIPQVNLYSRCPGSCCVRFSFASLDVSSSPHSLLSGEYTSGDQRGRLHRWPLDPSTGRLVSSRRTVLASAAFFAGIRKMQGAASIGSTFWISSSQPKSSSPTSPGSLARARNQSTIQLYRYPYPPEDMHYIPQTSELWSHTENPNRRYVFSIKPSRLGASCP